MFLDVSDLRVSSSIDPVWMMRSAKRSKGEDVCGPTEDRRPENACSFDERSR